MSRARRHRILVLGAGFAGLSAARRLGAENRVSVVARSPHFEFLPNIHELVSGVKTPASLRLPADRIVRRAGHRFVRGEVEAIDLEARRVHVSDRRPLAYDVLIVALGGVNATHGVAGVDEHSMPFKSVDDCARIGRRLAALGRSRKEKNVVIVGGGLEGVEALGEVLRRHRESALRVHLVESSGALLADSPSGLDRAVRDLGSQHGVHFVLESRVDEVRADAVVLESGREIPSDATIWTGGPAAPALLAECGLAPEAGKWAPVRDTLQSRHAGEVFVVGDAAVLGDPIAKQAYHAMDMGECAARNAERLIAGTGLRAYRPSAKPTLISFGDLGGFLVAGRLVLSGPPLATAKEAVYELVMAQLDGRSRLDAASAAFGRLWRAGRSLAWPALRSPRQWPRLARLRPL